MVPHPRATRSQARSAGQNFPRTLRMVRKWLPVAQIPNLNGAPLEHLPGAVQRRPIAPHQQRRHRPDGGTCWKSCRPARGPETGRTPRPFP
jgi:hypothetical protein